MRMSCALCGRPMDHAAVQIGEHPVGPKCAKRAGLLQLAKRKGGIVLPVVKRQRKTVRHEQQMPLDLEAAGA